MIADGRIAANRKALVFSTGDQLNFVVFVQYADYNTLRVQVRLPAQNGGDRRNEAPLPSVVKER
jgi:hypothetical protein